MDATALLLSRIQFAFTISFHIIFPAFTIGLAAWLTVLEALHLRTGKQVYQTLFEFWLKIFGIAFGLGVVSGVVMGFQFGTNWSELSKMSGPIQGPLLSYETFTASSMTAAAAQSHIDDLAPNSFSRRLHCLANLSVRIMTVLIDKRSRQLNFQRLFFQQID